MATVQDLTKKMWAHFNTELSKKNICSNELAAYNKIPGGFVTKTILSIGESLEGYWDSLVKDGWASLDPRILKPEFQQGTIVGGFKRTFIGPAPTASNIEIHIKRIKGDGPVPTATAKATISINLYNAEGNSVFSKVLHFEKGNYTELKKVVFAGEDFGFVIVIVDTEVGIKSFKYEIKYLEVPQKTDTAPVIGFADIHVHQTAEYAFAGNWMHGSMMGDPAVVLAPCKENEHDGKLVSLGLKNEKNRDEKNPTDPIVIKSGTGYPDFKDWPDHLDIAHQQVHEMWLKSAFERGLKLIVSCAVNNEILSLILGALWDKDEWRDMNSLEVQVKHIHEFAERNKSWCAIAYNPWHAREIIHSNKLAIVISLEASNIFPADKGDVEAQLGKMYCMGVRMLQIVHEVDNRFAGAAPQERPLVGMQTLSRLTRVSLDATTTKKAMDDGLGAYFMDGKDKPLGFNFDEQGNNLRGLSDSGEKLIEGMINRHMLIDTAHYSNRTLKDVFEIVKKHQYYPLCSSHTKFFAVLSEEEREVQREFVTTDEQVKYYIETGGILGLRTAPWVNKQVNPKSPAVVTDKKGEVGTARSFAQQLTFAKKKGVNFAFGSDLNGFTNQLGPRKKDGKKPAGVTDEYWSKGLRQIAMLPDLVTDLKYLNAPGSEMLGNSAEIFLKTWERTWDTKRQRIEG